MHNSQWYGEYFSEPYGEIYSDFLLPQDVAETEAQFVCDVLQLMPGERLLDCPCGYGRHIEEFRPLFPDMVGLDFNADCLTRASQFSPGGILVRGDMRCLPFADGAFDACISLFNSFGYFAEAENEKVLAEAFRVLSPGGRLLLDLANKIPLLELIHETPDTEYHDEGLRVDEHWKFNANTGRLHNWTRMSLAGRLTERGYDLQLYEQDEIHTILEQRGFELVQVYGDFDASEYDEKESPRLILVAKHND